MSQVVTIGIAIVGVVIIGIVVYYMMSSFSPSSQPPVSGGGKGSSKDKPKQPKFTLSDSDAVVFENVKEKIPLRVPPAKEVRFVYDEDMPTDILFHVVTGTIVWEGGIAFKADNGRSMRADVFAVGPRNTDGYLLYATLPSNDSETGSLRATSPSDSSETSTPIQPELFYGRLIQGDLVSPVSIDTGTVQKRNVFFTVSSVRDYLRTRTLTNDTELVAFLKTPAKRGRVSAVNAYAWVTKISTDSVSEPYEGDAWDAESEQNETNKSYTGRPGTLAIALAVKNVVTLTYTPHFTKELSKTPPFIAKVEKYAPINGNTLHTINGFWCDGQDCWLLYTKHTTTSISEFDLFVHIVYIRDVSNNALIYASTQKVENAFFPREFRYSPSLQQPYLKTVRDECVLLYVNKAACSSTGSVWRKISTAAWNGVKSLVRSIPGALQSFAPYLVGMALAAADTLSPEWGPYVTMGVNVLIGTMNSKVGAKITMGKYGAKYGLDIWNALAKQAHQKLESIAPGSSDQQTKPFEELKADNARALEQEKAKLKTMWDSVEETFRPYFVRSNVIEAEKHVYASFETEYVKAKALYEDALVSNAFEKVSDAIVVVDTLRFKRNTYDAQLKAAKANKPTPTTRPQIIVDAGSASKKTSTTSASGKKATQAGNNVASYAAKQANILLRMQALAAQLETYATSGVSNKDIENMQNYITTTIMTNYTAFSGASVDQKEHHYKILDASILHAEQLMKKSIQRQHPSKHTAPKQSAAHTDAIDALLSQKKALDVDIHNLLQKNKDTKDTMKVSKIKLLQTTLNTDWDFIHKDRNIAEEVKYNQLLRVIATTKEDLRTLKSTFEKYTAFPEVTALEEHLVVATSTLSLHARRLESLDTRVRDQQSQLDALQHDVVALTPKVENVAQPPPNFKSSLYF